MIRDGTKSDLYFISKLTYRWMLKYQKCQWDKSRKLTRHKNVFPVLLQNTPIYDSLDRYLLLYLL